MSFPQPHISLGMLESELSLASSSFVAAAVVADALQGGDAPMARGLHAAASVVSWLSMLWFLLGFRLTGAFVIILYHIVKTDLRRFLVLVGVVLIGFAQAFFVLKRGTGVSALGAEMRGAFGTMVSPEIAADEEGASLQVATGVFVVLATIMLLNLLVAMMGETCVSSDDLLVSRS